MLAGSQSDDEDVDKTIAADPPVASETPRPGGIPSLEMLRQLFPELDILDILGAGGMGAVYQARQPRLNRLVALKVMVSAPGHEADFALRFEREAQVLARLNHPHIVTLYDFGDLGPERTGADPLFYFLMEFVDGTDLGQLIKSKELQPAQALAIVPQICEALQYAHDQGITHRDIKPANILIDKRGTVKVADFGLAKMIGSAEDAMMTGLTQTGTAMGTPHYMAPEQWDQPAQVDHRADIYALGVVFYEMLTGERPAGVFEPPSKKSKSPVDKKLDGVVMRAMDKNPDRRYQQAGQIGDDVTRITGANKRKPTTHDAAKGKLGPLKSLMTLGLAGALSIGGWMLWQSGDANPPTATVPPETRFGPASYPSGATTQTTSTNKQAASSRATGPQPDAVPPHAMIGEPSDLLSKPGRLEGTGTMLNGKPLDLAKTAAYDDFVDVAGGVDRWVALRANGETVSSDGQADFTGIRKIARSYQSYYCFIDEAGGLRFHPTREMALPTTLKGKQVVDAACGSHHCLALLEGGQAVAFGRRYEEAIDEGSHAQGLGTPRWPQPDAAALENVAGVAATQTHAATLHHDGTVSVWGWEGAVKWLPEPKMKTVRQISSFHDGLHILDAAGQVWHFSLPRSTHPEQPVGFNGRVKLLGTDAVRLRDHLWLGTDGVWRAVEADRPTVEVLQSAPLRPESAFALRASVFGAKPYGYVLWIELSASSERASTSTATKDAPFINSLGMKFVPVPITGGPTDGQRVLFSIWETRVQDFETFARETQMEWFNESSVSPKPNHPVVRITWAEAQAFCAWLTERDRAAGKLGTDECYRLPSDHEWSCAAGIGALEDAALPPGEKHRKLPDVFFWGDTWPPPDHTGNYASEELRPLLTIGRHSYIKSLIEGYRDGHAVTAPVGTYPANALGLHDLSGNVLEWCEDWFDLTQVNRTNRGGTAWSDYRSEHFPLSNRFAMPPQGKVAAVGFRIVLATTAPPQVAPGGPTTLPAFTDREAAEWVLGLAHDDCFVKVRPLNDGPVIEVRKLAELPAEPFVIVELKLNPSFTDSPDLWKMVTDAEVQRLAGLKSLKHILIRGNVTGTTLKKMAHHPGLEVLMFNGMNLQADDLHHLRDSRLQGLVISMLHVSDPESLAALATMPNLRQLSLLENLDSAMAAALPRLPKLESLRADNSANTTDDVVPLLVEKFPHLGLLHLWGVKNLKGTTLGSLKALKNLTILGLNNSPVNDEALAQIAGIPQLLSLDLGQTRITDACLPTLLSFPKLEALKISQTELTDATLRELASIPTLKKLTVQSQDVSHWKPRVTFTAEGIATFEKLRPDVQVVK